MHREEWVLHKAIEAWQYAEAGRTLTPVSTELLKDLNNAADRNDDREQFVFNMVEIKLNPILL